MGLEDGEVIGLFSASYDTTANFVAFQSRLLNVGLLFILTTAIVMMLIFYLIRKTVGRPTREISDAMIRIASGDDDVKLPQSSNSRELAAIVDAAGVFKSYAYSMGRDLVAQKAALDLHSVVSITDTKGNITYVNEKFCTISGYTPEELMGQNHRLLKSGSHDPEFYKNMWKTIADGKSWTGTITNKNKHGELYWVRATIVPVLNEAGKPTKYIGIRTDITEQVEHERKIRAFADDIAHEKQMVEDQASNLIELAEEKFLLVEDLEKEIAARTAIEEKMRFMAQHDALTGLPNRRLFIEKADMAVNSAARKKGKTAILFIDIDGFKAVNDDFGHGAGDELLKMIARRLKDRLRSMDLVARFGGDEFVVLLASLDQDNMARVVAEAIVTEIRSPFEFDGNSLNVGASIGVAYYPDNGTSVQEVLENADKAMYVAKKSGKNQFHEYLEIA